MILTTRTSIKYQIERIQVELKAQKAEKKMKAIDEKLSEHKKEMEQYSSEVKAIEESFDAENKEYQVASSLTPLLTYDRKWPRH
jgi:chromosome segregation ATPase